jgi:hypothetical protein
MKTTKSVLMAVLLGAFPAAPFAQQESGASPSVVVASSISELASGYATACRQMSESRAVIFYQINGKIASLKGIRAVKAFNGVLFVTLSAGDSVAISAESVVLVTDGGRTP